MKPLRQVGKSVSIRNDAFTLIELLIVVGILAILAILMILLINPKTRMNAFYDAERKRELGNVAGIFDELFKENARYPLDTEVCYNTATNQGGVCTCNICGKAGGPASIPNYLNKIYCDPKYPQKKYVYQYDCSLVNNPQWYKLYAQLNAGASGTACNWGKVSEGQSVSPYADGCGSSSGGGGGNPTATPAQCPADPTNKYCIKNAICNVCGTFAQCQAVGACDQPLQFYQDGGCATACTQ